MLIAPDDRHQLSLGRDLCGGKNRARACHGMAPQQQQQQHVFEWGIWNFNIILAR